MKLFAINGEIDTTIAKAAASDGSTLTMLTDRITGIYDMYTNN